MQTRLRSVLAGIALLASLLLISAHAASAQSLSFPACETSGAGFLPQFTICEIVIPQTAYNDESLAYTEPDVKAVFTRISDNRQLTVHGFFERDAATNQIVFKIRFNASEVGDWRYDISCTKQANPGQTCNVTGNSRFFKVQAAGQKGFLRRDAGRPTKFVYDNGFHPFIWGQTYYQIVNQPVSGYNNWQTAVVNSKNKGLNKVRMLLYPWWNYYAQYGDTQPFNGPTTSPNHDAINLNHWRKFDQVVNYLYNQTDSEGSRMLAEVILFKDPALGKNASGQTITLDNNRTFGSAPQDDRYIRYAVARYAAFPNVIWSLSNEWQFAKNDMAYWEARAATLGAKDDPATPQNESNPSYDPWMFNASRTQQRATSIHPRNEARFSFAASAWPAHDVLQFSIGHTDCNGSPCANSDEWANFSILNNLIDNRPVVNDEYGYLNSKIGGNCANPVFSRENQRRGMWAIAVGGGYGTFGDNTGQCPDPGTTSPAIRADWVAQNAYNDTLAMTNFFKNTLNNIWWQMSPNNARVSKVSNSMRVYSMEGQNQYVVYAVRNQASGPGKFNVNLPVGRYNTTFIDPRGQTTPNTQSKRVTKPGVLTRFVTPTYDDWTLRIVNVSGKFSEAGGPETVWVWDNLPTGAVIWGDNETWTWVDADPTPISDSLAHQSNVFAGPHQHYFYGATETLTVNAGDTLFAYVYIDPLNPPQQVMLQWNDGTWEHRAYWGQSLLPWGVEGTNSRRYMGPLPAAGEWVKLGVPASAVGLEGRTLNGMAYSLYGGRATWDDAGKISPP